MKWLLIGLLVLVAIGAGLAAGQSVGVLHLPFIGHAVRRTPPPAPVSVDVPTITTNLGDADGTHFAQVSLTVSLADARVAKEFNAKLPAIEDAVIADLRETSSAQLNAAGGMTGLRTAVAASLTHVLGSPNAVQAVYFTQFIVQ